MRAILAIAASCCVAACAGPGSRATIAPETGQGQSTPAPSQVALAGAPEATGSPIDGLYHGTSTRFRADRRDCAHPGLVTLFVQNHAFEYRWDHLTDIDATIQPDGTVQGFGAGIMLQGRLAGQTIEGDVTNAACGLHFTAQKRF